MPLSYLTGTSQLPHRYLAVESVTLTITSQLLTVTSLLPHRYLTATSHYLTITLQLLTVTSPLPHRYLTATSPLPHTSMPAQCDPTVALPLPPAIVSPANLPFRQHS